MRDQYFEERAESKAATTAKKSADREDNEAPSVVPSKPRLKLKRPADDDPFVSDEGPQDKAKSATDKSTHKPEKAHDRSVEDGDSKINEDADESGQERMMRLASLKAKSSKYASNNTRKRRKVPDAEDEEAEEAAAPARKTRSKSAAEKLLGPKRGRGRGRGGKRN